MKIGYIRVSTKDQNTDRQVEMLREKVDKMYIDKSTGRNSDRPALNEMMSFIREGDTLVFESINRLARNMRDFLELIDKLQAKKVELYCIKDPIDTTTPTGRLVMRIMAAIAEMELDNIRERLHEGIAIAKARGVKFGRKPKNPKNYDEMYRKWRAGEISAKHAMRATGLASNTWYTKARLKQQIEGNVNNNG